MKKNQSTTEPPATPTAVRVKVLKNGLTIGTSTAARGAIVNVKAEDAAFFEERGEVQIIGPA
jgi:porphobilinogen deaminase